jgi:hypothetical protein
MKKDPLIDELRDAGREYVDSFKGNRKALVADLNRRSKADGRQVVSFPPRRVEPRQHPTLKAG